MVTRRARLALALLLLALAPAAVGTSPLPPVDAAGAPVPLAALPAPPNLEERAQDAYAGTTGQRLDREDVDVGMDLDFRDLDFDALGVVFGGGSFRADARLTARLDFHVLSVGRVQESVEDAAGRPVDLSEYGLDARDQYLTADAFRATLAGEALAAFQHEQEARVVRLVTESFPDVTVLQSRAAWSNTSASANARGDELPSPGHPAPTTDARDPPVTLLTVVELQYQKRQSLVGLLDGLWGPGADGDAALRERLDAASLHAPQERSAFALFGIPQVIHVDAPPGWDVALRLRLPEGFTFEEASPDVAVDGSLREARTYALARESDEEVGGTVAVTLGSRSLVAFAMLGAVLVAGALVRVPTLLAANRLMHPRR
jgi:hypothetical protein